jgi:hypothetical protein
MNGLYEEHYEPARTLDRGFATRAFLMNRGACGSARLAKNSLKALRQACEVEFLGHFHQICEWPRWAFTVISLMPSSPPTCLLNRLDTTNVVTSRSRGVSEAQQSRRTCNSVSSQERPGCVRELLGWRSTARHLGTAS